jgi:hypothetical protein
MESYTLHARYAMEIMGTVLELFRFVLSYQLSPTYLWFYLPILHPATCTIAILAEPLSLTYSRINTSAFLLHAFSDLALGIKHAISRVSLLSIIGRALSGIGPPLVAGVVLRLVIVRAALAHAHGARPERLAENLMVLCFGGVGVRVRGHGPGPGRYYVQDNRVMAMGRNPEDYQESSVPKYVLKYVSQSNYALIGVHGFHNDIILVHSTNFSGNFSSY